MRRTPPLSAAALATAAALVAVLAPAAPALAQSFRALNPGSGSGDGPSPFGAVTLLSVAADGAMIIAGDDKGILHRSSDGGFGWHAAGRGLVGAARGLALREETAVATTDAGVFRSDDGGRSFTATAITSAAQSAIWDGSVAWVAAGGQLYRSSDGAHTFRAIGPATDGLLLSLWSYEGTIYAASGAALDAPPAARRILRLDEKGNERSWTDLRQGAAVFRGGGRTTILVSNLGALRHAYSTDGERTWTERVFSPARMNTIFTTSAATGTLLFAGTGAGVLCSLDGGESFTSFNEGIGDADVRFFVEVPRNLLASAPGAIPVVGRTLLAFVQTPSGTKIDALELHGAAKGGLSVELFADIARKDLSAVNAILAAGADPRARIAAGTALHVAVVQGQSAITRLLLDHGADPNAPDGEGQPPLLAAVTGGSVDSVKALLARGADPRAESLRGASALDLAAGLGQAEIVDALLARGLEIDHLDRDGMTPLIAAASSGNTAVVRTLLEHGADPNRRSGAGHSAAGHAVTGGHYDVARLLFERGADAKEVDMGMPLLVIAAGSGDLPLVEAMLAHGADPRRAGLHDETALTMARAHHDVPIEQALLKRITH